MGIANLFGLLGRAARPPEKKTTIDISNYSRVLGGTAGRLVVTPETALQVTVVLACVRLIAQGVATQPLGVFRHNAATKRDEPAMDVPEWRLLRRRPCATHTSFEWRETMTAWAALTGDALSLKLVAGGHVDELLPLAPRQWRVEWSGNRPLYTIFSRAGEHIQVGPERVFHLRNLSWDGLRGLNISREARAAIALAAGAEGSQERLMNNGARPSGILTTEAPLKDEQIDRIVEGWRDATSGENAHSTPLLDGGIRFEPITLNAVDAEMVATRQHQIIEICMAFGVLPAVLGVDNKTQSFASVEAMQGGHLTQTLRPWLERWEQALDRDVLDQDGPLFAKFDTREMTKATTLERSQSYATLVSLGIMTRNEARELEGLPPIEGGDEPMTPLNMQSGEGGET